MTAVDGYEYRGITANAGAICGRCHEIINIGDTIDLPEHAHLWVHAECPVAPPEMCPTCGRPL